MDGKTIKQKPQPKLLKPNEIVVIHQQRKTFNQETIEGLASNMASVGQLSDLLVNQAECGHFVLIAGERRLRAGKIVGRNDPTFKMRCRVYKELDVREFLHLQGSENLHEQVPLPEQAEFYASMWELNRKIPSDHRWTFKHFCQEMGLSETKMRGFLKFVDDLHPNVAQAVRENRLSYGASLIIARVADQEKQLEFANRVCMLGLRIEDVRIMVDGHLDMLASGQSSFELLCEKGFEQQQLSSGIRAVLTRKATQNVLYLRAIQRSIEEGRLPSDVITPTVEKAIKDMADIASFVEQLAQKRKD